MKKIVVGQQVKLASMQNIIFEVTHINCDESYEIQTHLSEKEVLKYGNISAEMLVLVDYQN